ncbi:MAG: hypothetical protein ACFCGT_07415 [Sandaracinaceae bacterium]
MNRPPRRVAGNALLRALAPGLALLAAGCATAEPACPEGFTECAERCVDTDRDPRHCGACGNVCGDAEVCDGAGSCTVSCQAGLLECDGLCVDPESHRAFCGASMACSGDDAGERCGEGDRCVDGACRPTCAPGLLACADTCVDPETSNAFCGAEGTCEGDEVGRVCPPGQLCSGGACAANCAEGFVGCAGECIDPMSDVRFCGAANDCSGDDAGTACPAGQLCVLGECLLECPIDLVLCDGRCIDPQADHRYCGADDDCTGRDAGEECGPGQLCTGGRCRVSCGEGLVECDGSCVDPLTNNSYCGVNEDCFAGAVCAGGQLCDGGSCRGTCLETSVRCGTRCVDPRVSAVFCGASADCVGANAGEECGAGTVCVDGECTPTCPAGFLSCDGLCTDPMTSTLFCGATGDCVGANAGQACEGSERCLRGTCCPPGQIACAGGCVDPASDPLFCGASEDCQGMNAGTACTGADVCFGGVCVAPGAGAVETEVIDFVDYGWWNEDGIHTADNGNSFTGLTAGLEYNSYVLFDLTGPVEDAVAIVSVTLRMEMLSTTEGTPTGGYFSPDPSETFSVWDVSTDPVTLDTTTTAAAPNVAVHTDLESGETYGGGTVTPASQGVVTEIVLNASAEADVLAALGGMFAVGFTSDSVDLVRGVDDGFRWGDDSLNLTQQLAITYRTAP